MQLTAKNQPEGYDFTTRLLFMLCQCGANVPVMDFGLNVVLDFTSYYAETFQKNCEEESGGASVQTLETLRQQATEGRWTV